MTATETSEASDVIEHTALLEVFTQLCAENDLLAPPVGFAANDLPYGLSDPPTLLYV
jgi:hypothetical protein